MSSPDHLKVLVVDDDNSTRMLLRAFLTRLHYKVVEAANGQEGIEVFEREQPDIVIMDVTMPVMNGYEAVPVIKKKSGRRFVPIIYLTGLADDESLVKCVQSGGDVFLSKPINKVLLQAKLHAMRRILTLYGELEDYRQQMEEELLLTKHVFNTLTRRVREEVPGLRRWIRAAGHLPGDLVFYDKTPSGRTCAMLGDFTGHGFSAAIGALPVADIFFAMTRKDFKLADIIIEVNRKLYEILPTGHFCAACFVSSDPQRKSVEVWNGGLPEALMVEHQDGIVRRFPSQNFALGIVGSKHFSVEVTRMDNVAPGSLLIYSDGLPEAPNKDGEMFDDAGIEHAIANRGQHAVFDAIKDAVTLHLKDVKAPDDISLLELPVG